MASGEVNGLSTMNGGSSPRKRPRVLPMPTEESKAVVILGAQWGDEGKGKVVDMLAEQMDVVCRCQVSLKYIFLVLLLLCICGGGRWDWKVTHDLYVTETLSNAFLELCYILVFLQHCTLFIILNYKKSGSKCHGSLCLFFCIFQNFYFFLYFFEYNDYLLIFSKKKNLKILSSAKIKSVVYFNVKITGLPTFLFLDITPD